MTFEIALRSRLMAVDDVVASVEWGKRLGYPCVVLTIASWPRTQHMTGFDGWQTPRVQIDVMALDAPTKVALRDAILAALATSGAHGGIWFGRIRSTVIADMSEQTDTDFIHRDMIEAVLPHRKET